MIYESVIGALAAIQLLVLFSDDELKIGSIGVPTELAARGYTEPVITTRLRDEMRTMVLASGGTHETVPYGITDASFVEQIAEILHVAQPVDELRVLMGEITHELDAELVRRGGRLYFDADLFQLPSGPTNHVLQPVDEEDIEGFVAEAAKWVMRNLDPLTLARYEFTEAKITKDFSLVREEIENCRRFYDSHMRPAIDNMEGKLYLATGDAAAAEGFFRRALRGDPTYVESKLNLAVASAVRGDVAAAEALLTEAAGDASGFWAKRRSIEASVLALRGVIADHRGAGTTALKHLRAAVAADPDMAQTNALLAAALRDRGMDTLALYHERRVSSLHARRPAKLPLVYFDVNVLRRLLPPGGGASGVAARDAPSVGRG